MIIKNGLVALSGADNFEKLDIEVKNGKITKIAKEICGDEEIIHAYGCYVFPGAIDPHVHFNDPGFPHHETFYSGTCAAAAGGITTIIDMPCTSIPAVTNLNNFKTKLNSIKDSAVVDYGFYGGVSGQTFSASIQKDMKELAEFVLGFKVYTISGMKSFKCLDYTQIAEVLNIAAQLQRPALVHSEDEDVITKLTLENMKKGSTPIYFYNSRPESAETESAMKLKEAIKINSDCLHIVHVGTASVVDIISGTGISCETAPHYLAFDVNDFVEIGSALKISPPVKQPQNKDKLWDHLRNGKISLVATDHAPATLPEKNTGSIWTDYSGIPGCETMIPYVFSEGFLKKRISLSRYLQITSENAAERYGIFDKKGSIEVGKDADFTIINPNEETKIIGEKFYSKGKVTPFENMLFTGKIKNTIVRGKAVYTSLKGIAASAGYGNLIKAK